MLKQKKEYIKRDFLNRAIDIVPTWYAEMLIIVLSRDGVFLTNT
jgi:hypothetical protein